MPRVSALALMGLTGFRIYGLGFRVCFKGLGFWGLGFRG